MKVQTMSATKISQVVVIGAGIFGVLFPLIVADLTAGTGHFNIAQGAIATAQGIGGALSTSVAGAIVVGYGYGAAFITLGIAAGIALALLLLLMPEPSTRATVPAIAP